MKQHYHVKLYILISANFQHTSQSFIYKALSTESFFYNSYSVIHHAVKSKILSLFLLHSMLKFCYNLWNLLSTWLFLLTNMMNVTDNSSSSVSTTNLNACVNSTDNNSCNYLSFNMSLMLSYTNNQLIYYFISDAISVAEQAQFQQLMKQHKISLELLEWDNTFNKNNESDTLQEDFIIFININSNSDCSALLLNYKNIKINSSNILKLMYNSTVI